MRNYVAIFLVITASMYQVSAVDASVQLVSADVTAHAYVEMVGGLIDEHFDSGVGSASASAFVSKEINVDGELLTGYVESSARQSILGRGFIGGYEIFSQGGLLADSYPLGAHSPGVAAYAETSSSSVFSVSDQSTTVEFLSDIPPAFLQYQLIDLKTGSTILSDVFDSNFFQLDLPVGTYQFNQTSTFVGTFDPDLPGDITANWDLVFIEPNQNVPEPASLLVWSLLGLVGVGVGSRRRRIEAP